MIIIYSLILLSVFSIALITVFNLSLSNAQLVTQFEEGPRIIKDNSLKTEIVSKLEIDFPTSMAFLNPNDILVLEKNKGTVRKIVNGTLTPDPLLDVNVANKNERGMLGIAIDTNSILDTNLVNDTKDKNETVNVFLYYTESKKRDGEDVTENKEPLGNRLYRYELVNNKLINPKLLLDLPTTTTGIHNGGKIAIGPDENIYLTVGDLGIFDLTSVPTLAQNIEKGRQPDGTGGILRVTRDGHEVHGGILGRQYPLNLYYGYGIRNSFGIDFDPLSGNMWDTENGPSNGDELNLVKPGFNSGWGKVQGVGDVINQTILDTFNGGKDLVNFSGLGNYSSPQFVWNFTVGVTDLKFLNNDKLGKNYRNDMFVGDFHTGNLYHFDFLNDRTGLLLEKPLLDKQVNDTAGLETILFGKGFGGITDLEVGPDGYLYVLALSLGGGDCDPNFPNDPCVSYSGTNSGTIFKIVPGK